ncbi:MAG: hypothetical protein KIT19_03365 [Phycisphaeraceae bacterium]|nr:hypothetical protein [Phycisphaeraceae bacterium]
MPAREVKPASLCEHVDQQFLSSLWRPEYRDPTPGARLDGVDAEHTSIR